MDSHLLDKSHIMAKQAQKPLNRLLMGVVVFIYLLLELTVGVVLGPFVMPFISKETKEEFGC